MANPYRELFKAPGSGAFVLAAMIARMPISMTGIGLITMLSQVQGGYAMAGAVASIVLSVYAIGSCLAGLAFGAAGSGWLVDAFGARSGFWLAIAAGAVVLGSAIPSYRHLK
ncbi:hypothetical protein ASD91_23655 [Pseudomonas sp. Root68]|nr:hypothetical protein ASD91_23655 [Pseudomonas sp. Root68]KRB63551.1 hypothetical protein ASD95_17660 [Pseudomonas sp. Root71]